MPKWFRRRRSGIGENCCGDGEELEVIQQCRGISMSRKLFYQLTAKVVGGKVLLSFWQSTPVYHDKSMPPKTVFTF